MGTTSSVIRQAVVVWSILVIATVTSYFFGVDHPFAAVSLKIASVSAIVLAVVKVVLIGTYFMEIRHAPTALRWAFAVWVVAIGGALVVLDVLT